MNEMHDKSRLEAAHKHQEKLNAIVPVFMSRRAKLEQSPSLEESPSAREEQKQPPRAPGEEELSLIHI